MIDDFILYALFRLVDLVDIADMVVALEQDEFALLIYHGIEDEHVCGCYIFRMEQSILQVLCDFLGKSDEGEFSVLVGLQFYFAGTIRVKGSLLRILPRQRFLYVFLQERLDRFL